MKRVVFLLVIAFAVTAIVTAQSYTVHEVKGRVEKEVDGKKVIVTDGEVLDSETVIHTRIGTSLTLSGDGKTVTIPAARSGKLGKLVAEAPANNVKITGNVNTVDTTEASRTRAQASTASARASDKSSE